MKKALWTNPDGKMIVVSPIFNTPRQAELGETDDELIARVIPLAIAKWHTARAISLGTPPAYFIVDDDDPATKAFLDDFTFREAWVQTDGVPSIDMPKARVVHMTEIRRVRNLELAVKDIAYTKAVEAGDTDAQATIATEKQVLRDIPATFDITTSVTTPAQLKAKWPTELPAR